MREKLEALPLVGLLIILMGIGYVQAQDSLTVEQSGNIGIGTTTPGLDLMCVISTENN